MKPLKMMTTYTESRIIIFVGLFWCIGFSDAYSQNFNELPFEAKKFNLSQLAGIVRYDVHEVGKKIKLKNESTTFISMQEHFAVYHHRLDSLELGNRKLFDSLSYTVDINSFIQNGMMDFYQFRNRLASVKLAVEPIRAESKQIELDLNRDLVSLLSGKQYQKWLLFHEKSKREVLPRMPMPMAGPPDEFLR